MTVTVDCDSDSDSDRRNMTNIGCCAQTLTSVSLLYHNTIAYFNPGKAGVLFAHDSCLDKSINNKPLRAHIAELTSIQNEPLVAILNAYILHTLH